MNAINLPAYVVEYVGGYLGCGVNETVIKYFRTAEEQTAFAEEKKGKVMGLKTYKLENFYHTLPEE